MIDWWFNKKNGSKQPKNKTTNGIVSVWLKWEAKKSRSFNKINDVYHFKSIDCCDSIFYIAFLETRHTATTTTFFFEIFIEMNW